MTAKEPRFSLVQAARGLAALWVVLFHASEGHHIEAIKASTPSWLYAIVFDAGHYGVAVFFSLSGFVIAHSIRNADFSARYFFRFALRRSIRLDPPYWASMAFVVAMAAVSASVIGRPFVAPSFSQIVAHIFYLQEIIRVPEISSVYWTLTYEVQFYIVLVGAMVLSRRAAPIALAVLAAVSVVSAPEAPGLFVNLWCAFYVGVLAYWAKDSKLATIGLFALASVMAARSFYGWDWFFVISAGSAVILFAAMRTGRLETGLDYRPLQLLGTVSYSLYLIHNSITGAVAFVAHRLLGSGLAADAGTLLLIIGASVSAAWLFWRLIERPSQSLASTVKAKPQGADASIRPEKEPRTVKGAIAPIVDIHVAFDPLDEIKAVRRETVADLRPRRG